MSLALLEPTGRDARRGPCFFRHRLPRPLRLVYLTAEEKGATRGTLDFWPRSRPWPVALCHRRRPIQPAGLGPLRVSSVPAHKIGKCLFLCVVPLPASSPSSPTPMGRCRPFTPPLSLLVLFLATPSLTAPFQRDQKAVNSSGRSLGPHPPNAPTASSPPRPPSSACSSRLDRQGTAPKNSDGG